MDLNEYSLQPFLQYNSSTIAKLQRINVGDILSDFESQITEAAASVQARKNLSDFHGCTFDIISINVILKSYLNNH